MTNPLTRAGQGMLPSDCRNLSVIRSMASKSVRSATVGYIVSTWPRLSQTFVLNEIVALERLGVPLRIFSAKDPGGEPVHAEVAKVRAEVTYLSLGCRWKRVLWANLWLAHDLPGRYARTLLKALRYCRWGVVGAFSKPSTCRTCCVENPSLICMLTSQQPRRWLPCSLTS